MARAFPASQPTDYGTPSQPGDWQALRGELEALLDQVEGQYAPPTGASDAAFAGFAQRMRDLRYQVADTNPDDRRREALRSVKRQIERFNERDEPEPVLHADNVLQSAIQQIRARTGGAAPRADDRVVAPAMAAPAPAPRFDQLSQSMAGLSGRLAQFEAELKTQRGNAAQVKEIADQVSQLSHVMELLAGAVGETGQVKRLESQIAGLAQLMTQAQKPDLTQMTERLDALSATVDRLADLQVQQIQHVVREAEAAPQANAETTTVMRSIEESVRSIYDRLDRIESNASAPRADLEQVTAALAQISARLGSESGRPERLLGLVNALNSRINEVEDRSEGIDSLKGDIEALRTAIVGAIEPRFASIESRLGDLDEKLQGSDGAGMAQIEAQIRQLVARMDQTGEQLSGLAQLYSAPSAAPDFEALAHLAATRTSETISRNAAPAPDFNAVAELVAAHTADAVARLPQPVAPDFLALADEAAARALAGLPQAPVPDFSALADQAAAKAAASMRLEPASGRAATEAGLAEFESRITRLIDGLLRARPPEAIESVTTGIGRVEERLAALETALTRRIDAGFAAVRSTPAPTTLEVQGSPKAAAASAQAAPAPLMSAAPATAILPPAAGPQRSTAVEDAMPRNPAAEAPLKEFGFPDLGPVRAALEAKNGPRRLAPGMAKPAVVDPHFDMEPMTPEMAGGIGHAKPAQLSTEAPPADFDPAQIARPPRPQSSLDTSLPATAGPPEVKAPVAVAPEVSASTRNTFIEAARRAAQRQNQSKSQADANSLMGRAFARFQQGEPAADRPGKADAPIKAAPAPAGRMVTPEPPPPELPVKISRKDKKQLARDAKKAAALQLPVDVAAAPAEQPNTSKQSFLVRHRRPILLGASLAAVIFMALNLVMQRLSTHEDQSVSAVASSAVSTAPSSEPAAKPATPPAVAMPAAPTPNDSGSTGPSAAPAPTSDGNPSGPAPKPVSEAAPVTISPSATASSPRIISTDPTTTASIAPAAAMNFAPSSTDAVMPPALAAANTAAGATPDAAAAAPTTTASIAPAADSVAPTAAAPAAMNSPVTVEMPPAGLGPEELRQAAANGDARAQFEIAAIYSEGRAVPADFGQAEVWYERAAAQGFGPAQYRLGNLYENGKGVTKDLEQARLWYQRSAEAGNRMAMHNLAALYASGQLGKQDFTSAAEWFERAANLGMKDSQFNLGMLYARGLGVQQNLETSYQWFALAAATGDADAAKARDNIGRSLDAAALKRVTAAVAAWKPAQIDLAANFAPIGTWEKTFNPGPAITDKAIITKVQGALIRLGYDIGTANGHVGTKTADAIKAFERGTGMTEVGAINPRLLAVLGSQPV